MESLNLVMDRTCWKRRGVWVNLLAVGVAFEGRAVPLYWQVVNRAGNSSLQQQQAVLQPVIEKLQAHPHLVGQAIVVLADREFASPKLAQWLWQSYQVNSRLRLKRSLYLVQEDAQLQLATLLKQMQPGQTHTYLQVCVTRNSSFRLNVVLHWHKGYAEPWLLASTLEPSSSVLRYRQRCWVEPMFKDTKSNGFQIEDTRVTQAKRIESVWIVRTFAHIFSVLEGWHQETSKPEKKTNDRSAYSWSGIVA